MSGYHRNLETGYSSGTAVLLNNISYHDTTCYHLRLKMQMPSG